MPHTDSQRRYWIPLAILMALFASGCARSPLDSSDTLETPTDHPLLIDRPEEIGVAAEQVQNMLSTADLQLEAQRAARRDAQLQSEIVAMQDAALSLSANTVEVEDSGRSVESSKGQVEMIEALSDGYAVMLPDEFEVRQSERSLIMDKESAIGSPNFLLSIYPMDANHTPEIFLDSFIAKFSGSIVSTSEPEIIEINGATGLKLDLMLVASNGIVLTGNVVGLQKGNTTALIFGSANSSEWQNQYSQQFDELLATVELYPLPDDTVASLTRVYRNVGRSSSASLL